MSYATTERAELCALLTELGPDAPTLCEGWTTADMAAHLVIRERRPDAGPGILLPPFAGYTERIQRAAKARLRYADLVDRVRTGPPRWSFYGAIPGVDAAVNTMEYFIHHEDVRRAQPGTGPREIDPELADLLWRRLRVARLILRSAPTGVELIRTDGAGGRLLAHRGEPRVQVRGPAAELTLWVTGRTGAAEVTIEGEDEQRRRLADAHWGL